MSTSHAALNSLALILYGRLFYTLSDVFAYVQDFPVGQDRIYVYETVVKQLESAFASGLMKAIKKNKSWALASWSESEVDQLMTLLLRHMRADYVGRNCREGALKTINKH